MKNTRLKIDNFLENKLENLVVIKGGEDGGYALPADPSGGSGGGSNTTGGGGGGDMPPPPPPPFPPIDPRLSPVEAPDVP